MPSSHLAAHEKLFNIFSQETPAVDVNKHHRSSRAAFLCMPHNEHHEHESYSLGVAPVMVGGIGGKGRGDVLQSARYDFHGLDLVSLKVAKLDAASFLGTVPGATCRRPGIELKSNETVTRVHAVPESLGKRASLPLTGGHSQAIPDVMPTLQDGRLSVKPDGTRKRKSVLVLLEMFGLGGYGLDRMYMGHFKLGATKLVLTCSTSYAAVVRVINLSFNHFCHELSPEAVRDKQFQERVKNSLVGLALLTAYALSAADSLVVSTNALLSQSSIDTIGFHATFDGPADVHAAYLLSFPAFLFGAHTLLGSPHAGFLCVTCLACALREKAAARYRQNMDSSDSDSDSVDVIGNGPTSSWGHMGGLPPDRMLQLRCTSRTDDSLEVVGCNLIGEELVTLHVSLALSAMALRSELASHLTGPTLQTLNGSDLTLVLQPGKLQVILPNGELLQERRPEETLGELFPESEDTIPNRM